MRILILNWRDIKNPLSGGAEILTHEIARRWVKWGHEVVQFSSKYADSKPQEVIDGVTIIRRGNPDARYLFTSVHFLAFLYYRSNKNTFDAVIDEIHGIPFFTPWYVKGKKVALICEVAGVLWFKIFGLLLGSAGVLIEKIYLYTIYRNISYLTISKSTKKDLIKNGVKSDSISVLPMGFSVPSKMSIFKKEKAYTLIFVGRLTVAKGIEDVLKALALLKRKIKNITLWIVGRGDDEYTKHLQELIIYLGIKDNVTFFGFISEEKKFSLMGKAHVLVHSSIKEGFGLTIPEAGYVGTPVVAYNASGLKDIVIPGKNGILTEKNSPEYLAKAVEQLSNGNQYNVLAKGAREESMKYNWDNTAKFVIMYLKNLK